MIADRLLESPLHAARFVSLIPFARLEAPGAEKVEVWHSMQAFLARVSFLVSDYNWYRDVETARITLCCFVIYCWVSAWMPTL